MVLKADWLILDNHEQATLTINVLFLQHKYCCCIHTLSTILFLRQAATDGYNNQVKHKS